MGDWPADKRLARMGSFMRMATLSGMEGYALVIQTRMLGKSIEEAQLALIDIRKDVKNSKFHSYSLM
jgi:hypothetical protein